MINLFKAKKLRQRCRMLALGWINDLAGATEEQALEFIDSGPFFDHNHLFNLKKSDEYNTDLAILRTLDFRTSLEIEFISNGMQIYNDLKPGVIGIHSVENFHQLRITYGLGSVYVAHLMTKVEESVPDGFLSSTILNTEINFLDFIGNFYKWKNLPAITKFGELPLEIYLKKLDKNINEEADIGPT